MSEWISVEERLPDEDILVVAAHHYSYCQIPDAAVCRLLHGMFYLHEDGITAENYDGGARPRLDMEVTHWMPLPAPQEDL